MAERTRTVTKSEYFAELGKLSGKIRRRRHLRSTYFTLMARLSALARERTRLIRRIPYADIIERVRIGTRISEIEAEYTRVLEEMRRIHYFELAALEEDIATERTELAEKIIPPPIREEFIADEECSGMNIYFDLDGKNYNVRDPDTRELIRTNDKIAMELTASISTRTGHDKPLLVEITCTTYVEEMGLSELIAAEKKVEEGLRNWLLDKGWGYVIHAFEKVGVAYNSEGHILEVGRYPWTIPDYPEVYVLVEKKAPRERTYSGKFTVE